MSALRGTRGRTSRVPEPTAVRAALEIASGPTPRSLEPVTPGDAIYTAATEDRWHARIACFGGPGLYVPMSSPPHAGVLVRLALRDRSPAVGEVLWSRNELPMAGCAVRYVRLAGTPSPPTEVTMDPDAWERLIASQDVPALPEAAAGVLRAAGSARSGAADLAKSLSQDASLSEAVIDLANSANFRAAEPLRDARSAVVRLGMERVRSLVLASSVFRIFPAEAGAAAGVSMDLRLSPDGLWMHSLATALIAESFARLVSIPSDDAFLAGLFHDIGKFFLARSMRAGYSGILDQVEEWGLPLEEAEKTIWGFSHAKAGGWLLSKWGLPGHVVAAVAGHHVTGPGQVSPIAAAAHIGDYFARALAAGTTWDRRMPQVEPRYWDAMKIEPQDATPAIEGAALAVATGAGVFEQAGVRAPFLPRTAQATEADPILRSASEAVARRRRDELFEGQAMSNPYLAALARGASTLSDASS